MLAKLRSRLTYANVMSTLAVFIALGGSSYAAVTINGIEHPEPLDLRPQAQAQHAHRPRDQRVNARPRAPSRDADRLEGMRAADFKIKCPSDTFPIADVCVERTPRPASSLRQRGPAVPQVGTPRARPSASDPRRASGGAGGCSARGGRRADLQRLSVEFGPGAAGCPLRHRSGRQRGADARHGCRREGLPLCHRPIELTMTTTTARQEGQR